MNYLHAKYYMVSKKKYKQFEYRCYPNLEQEPNLFQMMGNRRFVWNNFLQMNNEQYEKDKTFIWYKPHFDRDGNLRDGMSKLLTKFKEDNPFLYESDAASLQNILRDLELALKQAHGKNKIAGKEHPVFKCKKDDHTAAQIDLINNNIKIHEKHIEIPKLGLLRTIFHRPYQGIIKHITIHCRVDHWYVTLCCDITSVPEHIIQIDDIPVERMVGVDVGLSATTTTTDGHKSKPPKFYRRNEKKLKRKQRALARKKIGSKNREKTRIDLAKTHRKIFYARHDHCHQLSREIANLYDLVFIEDLDIKGLMMQGNSALAKAFGDQGLGKLMRFIDNKSMYCYKIGRYEPSTKTCCKCGHKKHMDLKDRIYECDHCGLVIDRDINAAINILIMGLKQIGQELPEFRLVELISRFAMKQETSSVKLERESSFNHGMG